MPFVWVNRTPSVPSMNDGSAESWAALWYFAHGLFVFLCTWWFPTGFPICHLTLELTEKAFRPLLTSCQPLKTSSNVTRFFCLDCRNSQLLVFGCEVDFENSAAWEWLNLRGLNSVPCQSHAYFRAWESGTWHSFLLCLYTTLCQRNKCVSWCKYTICWP